MTAACSLFRCVRGRWRAVRGTTGDEGAVTVEMILATPLLILFLLLVVGLGSVVSNDIALDGVAAAAARAASIATTPAAATAAAQASVSANGLSCVTLHVATDTADFTAGGTVDVTLTCTVDLSAFAGLHLPATTTLTSSASQVLDDYRSYGQ